MRDQEQQQDKLARIRMAGHTGIIITVAMLALALLLRIGWRLAIPLTVFGAGIALFAGDALLSRLPSRASQWNLDRISLLHYLFDICAITFAIHQLGGSDWLGAFFYLFVILHANISFGRAHGLLVTAICIAAFVSSMLLAYHGLLPDTMLFPQHRWVMYDPDYTAAVILVVGVGGMLVFSLTFGTFADALRRKTEELRESNARLQQAAERLQGHRDELEREVERRTGDLRTALCHLRSAHEELKRMDQLKTNFLANVSHELRTPLTSIRSFAEILLRFPDEESTQREEFLQIVVTESDRLTRLIDDVLDITKIESGHMEWSFSSVELPSLLSFCLRTMTPLAEEKGLSLRLQVPANLPPVHADRDRVAQVLNNLLANALKFTASGRITVGAAVGDEQVRVYVSDTGPGIPEGEREQIFKKFHQIGEGLTAKPRGTGLGLAISAEIIAAHGGRLWVDSAPGSGSTFHFTLPVAGREPAPQPAARGRRGLVLIADNEPGARNEHRRALEQAGYAVREAADGTEALRLASSCAPDLICIDVLTPGMSGLDVLRALRTAKDTRHIPVIMLSVMEDKQWALQLGAARHLVKPVAGVELVAAAAEALATDRARGAGDGSQEMLRV